MISHHQSIENSLPSSNRPTIYLVINNKEDYIWPKTNARIWNNWYFDGQISIFFHETKFIRQLSPNYTFSAIFNFIYLKMWSLWAKIPIIPYMGIGLLAITQPFFGQSG